MWTAAPGSRRTRRIAAHLVNHALLRVDERRELRQQHAAHGRQIALSLQHAGEARQIGLEPVLLGVAVGREAKVVDHRVDVVLQLRHFAAGFHLNRAGKVALGHGSRHFRDGANLVGQVIGQQIDVAGRSFHVPAAPGTLACPPSRPSTPTSRATVVT